MMGSPDPRLPSYKEGKRKRVSERRETYEERSFTHSSQTASRLVAVDRYRGGIGDRKSKGESGEEGEHR